MRDILFCHDNDKYPADDVYNKLYKENVYELDGILQTFDNIGELNTIYKYLIKYDRLSDEAKDIMKEKIHEIETELIKRVETAISDGFKIISFADPLSGIEFLGKKGARVYIDTILLNIIHKLKDLCESNDCRLHLCPKLSNLLKSYGEFYFKQIELEGSYYSMVEALLSKHGEHITAGICIHFRGEIGRITAFRLD